MEIYWVIRVTLVVKIRNGGNKAFKKPLWQIKFWKNDNKICLKAKEFRN